LDSRGKQWLRKLHYKNKKMQWQVVLLLKEHHLHHHLLPVISHLAVTKKAVTKKAVTKKVMIPQS
jgi:hypothetical protein